MNYSTHLFYTVIHSQEWSIWNFSCSLTSSITSHSMTNLAFHSLLWWKMIIPIPSTSLIHLSLKSWGNVLFELGTERNEKIGRWSEVSLTKRPQLTQSSRLFVKVLSIKVAECGVILVGLVISGTNIREYNTSRNVPVVSADWWFIRFKLILSAMKSCLASLSTRVFETTLDWFRSYLSNRKQFVQFNGHCSLTKSIKCGVKQGPILGRLFCYISVIFLKYLMPWISSYLQMIYFIFNSWMQWKRVYVGTSVSLAPSDVNVNFNYMHECLLNQSEANGPRLGDMTFLLSARRIFYRQRERVWIQLKCVLTLGSSDVY